MNIGTRSVLFGAHQFLLHPLCLAIAWRRLYGFPWDPRLWAAFFLHDLGYIGSGDMDGPEGEKHVELGANIMRALSGNSWGNFAAATRDIIRGPEVSRFRGSAWRTNWPSCSRQTGSTCR